MWSDPIDELIRAFEKMVDERGEEAPSYARTLAAAKRQRELENRTGKVGFEATCA